jgi:RNA polymerase sigma-70 factor (ECF subfamily)
MREKEFIRCELLVVRWQKGDRESAAKELVELFERPVLYYVRRLVRSEDDAWDAMQETFVAVLRSLSGIREGRALPAFVYRTARNAALAQHRRRRDEPLVEDVAEMVESAAEPEIAAEEAAEVHRCLELLPLLQREALTLFFLEDLSIAQIAEVTEVPEGTVKSRLFHAKRALRGHLGGGHLGGEHLSRERKGGGHE